MRAYLIVTGVVFGLLALAHVWRVVEEGLGATRNPWFILTTLLAVTLSGWAWRLLSISSRRLDQVAQQGARANAGICHAACYLTMTESKQRITEPTAAHSAPIPGVAHL